MIADRTSPAVDSLPSFDLSKLLIGQVVLSSLAALYSDEAPQWNIPLALYGLVTVQAAQVTPESLSTFLLLFGSSLVLDLGKLLFGSGGYSFFFFLNFLLKPLTLWATLGQLRQTSAASFSGGPGGGIGDRILNATSGFPPFGHRQPTSETVWSAPPNATAPPGSYQTRFSLDDDASRDLETGQTSNNSVTEPPLYQNAPTSRSAPATVQQSANQKSFVPPPERKKSSAGYHTLE
ncbi:hypothetical protein JCM3766R1_001192 [Sporobolomyces carnicolor]